MAQEWARTALIRQRVRLDAWVMMPDHFHGIVGIIEGPRKTDWSGETVGVETPRVSGGHRRAVQISLYQTNS